ncbi:MAG: response regulator transcription factor [Calditrichales bacterium]|nr:MAG: response regulator transcription factor [Calditrichales bacterium]
MNAVMLSNDYQLVNVVKKAGIFKEDQLRLINDITDPLEIMSAIISIRPGLIIVDDDMLKPDTARLLKSIKKVYVNIFIIFITSDSSIELGREISQLGVQFYAHKPLDAEEVVESLISIMRLRLKGNGTHFN